MKRLQLILYLFLSVPMRVYFADAAEPPAAAPAQVTSNCQGPWSLTHQEPSTCRPYAGSMWTKRLPADIMSHLQPNSKTVMPVWMQSRGGKDSRYWIDLVWPTPGSADYRGQGLNYGKATDPLYKYTCNAPNHSCSRTNPTTGLYFHLPVGSSISLVDPGDAWYFAWDQTNDLILEIYRYQENVSPDTPMTKIQPCRGTTPETACEITLDHSIAGAISRKTTDAAHVRNISGLGDSLSSAPQALTIRASEMIDGEINHPLYIVTDCVNDNGNPDGGTAVFPAYPYSGSYGCGAGYIGHPEASPYRPYQGNLIFADYTDAQIAAMNIPSHNKIVLRALAHYGAYVGDSSNWSNPGIFIENYESMQPYVDAGIKGTDIPIWNWLQKTEGMECSGPDGTTQCKFNFHVLKGVPDLAGPLCPTTPCSPLHHFHIADPCVAKGLAGLPGGCGTPAPIQPKGLTVTGIKH
jgi:hypothetical protein